MIVRTTEEDTRQETEVASILERVWNCEVVRTSYLDGLDFWLVRNGTPEAVAELKNRLVKTTTYDEIFLSQHKWDALHRASEAHQIEALFIVNFTDQLRYIRLSDIDATNLKVGGRADRTDAPNDREIMVMVPVSQMKAIHRWGQ